MNAICAGAIPAEENKQEFEELYEDYKDLLFAVSYRVLRDTQLAEDAVQQTFLRIMRPMNKMSDVDPCKIKGFLVSVARNVAKDMYTERKLQLGGGADIMAIEVADRFDLEDTVSTKMDFDSVMEAINGLPDIYKTVLILKFVNGLDDNEIADALQISAAAVRKRLQRARKMLKESCVYIP